MNAPLAQNDLELGHAIAQTLLEGFNHHYALFREASRAAQANFEAADIHAQQNLVRDRIAFYDLRVKECVQRLKDDFNAESLPDSV